MRNRLENIAPGLLSGFADGLKSGDVLGRLSKGLIGGNAWIDGPFGRKPMLYADYVASGRALRQIEHFILDEVLPYYANSHTEASFCGGFMTRLRRDARAVIASLCGATEEHAIIFAGAGATAGINRLVKLLGIQQAVAAGKRATVIVGPYEHHSNILPWRESGADVVEIEEAANGGPDLGALAAALRKAAGSLTVCSFSAASNVTGIVTDVEAVTRLVKTSSDAAMVWDYAGAGPYLPINMSPAGGVEIDAIVVSPHKFIGGPGASGILIVRRDAVRIDRPSLPGGGTVRFVSSTGHDYSERIEAREEAGTPNVVGDIRAALAFLVKDVIGDETFSRRNDALTKKAMAAWGGVDGLELLGLPSAPRLPIFSFRLSDANGRQVHQQLVTRMLSDRFGIQARGGCACAGPYVHRLLGINANQSERMRHAILSGDEVVKPGFTRLNFSVLLTDEKAKFIIDSVAQLASDAASFEHHYRCDSARAIFFPKAA